MTRLTVTQENAEKEEYDFAEEIRTITLGRRTTNDICIADLSVSGNHARITLGDAGAMLEDLNSTNGTYVNGRLISRQLLNENDEIVCGKSRVVFEPELADAMRGAGGEHHSRDDHPLDGADDMLDSSGGSPVLERVDSSVVATAPAAAATQVHPANRTLNDSVELRQDAVRDLDDVQVATPGAVIEIKNGAKSGQVLPIDKPVTTLGRPGIQIAAIMKKPEGYFLMHIESEQEGDRPTLNTNVIGDEPVQLHSGDSLNVAGIDVQFMLS